MSGLRVAADKQEIHKYFFVAEWCKAHGGPSNSSMEPAYVNGAEKSTAHKDYKLNRN